MHGVSLVCATTSKCAAARLAFTYGLYGLAVFGVGAFVVNFTIGFVMERDHWFVLGTFYGVLAVVCGCMSAALQAKTDRHDKKVPNERVVAAWTG